MGGVIMVEFRVENPGYGFNYVLDTEIKAGETILAKIPRLSPNKRGVNDIGWMTDGDVHLYGTLCRDPEREDTLWQEIEPFDEINKTISAIKIENKAEDCRVVIRIILN